MTRLNSNLPFQKEKHGRFPALAKIFGKLSGTSNRNNSNDYDDAADEDNNKNTNLHNDREKPQKTKSIEQFTDVRNRSTTSVRFKELAEEAQWKEEQEQEKRRAREEQERKKAEEAQMEELRRARSLEWAKSLERVKSLQKEAEQADSKAFEVDYVGLG